jgi:DNA-binding CsgD family transcriptional regulator
VDSQHRLTAQELQIAELAAESHSNPEIAAQLFISWRTVEYHLHEVVLELHITRRHALASLLDTPLSALCPAPRMHPSRSGVLTTGESAGASLAAGRESDGERESPGGDPRRDDRADSRGIALTARCKARPHQPRKANT